MRARLRETSRRVPVGGGGSGGWGGGLRQAVIRLSEPKYDASPFRAGGLAVADLPFPDCAVPPAAVVGKCAPARPQPPTPNPVRRRAVPHVLRPPRMTRMSRLRLIRMM